MRQRDAGRKLALRWILYILGLLTLSVGITLNTKTSLGVSPILSVAYSVSEIAGLNFGNTTFVWYSVFVAVEVILHLIRPAEGRRANVIKDLLQLPICLIFTRFLNIFGRLVPVFSEAYPDSFLGSLSGRVLLLLLAILLTGIGAAVSLFVRLVPNPGDGIVQGISDFTGLPTGNTKNIVDICCVSLTCLIGLIFARRIVGIGLGTLLAMVFVGRVVAAVDRFFGAAIRGLLP